MTFREWAKSYCVERGMFDHQADAVVAAVMADDVNEPMRGRWDDHTEGYPRQMLALLSVELDRQAVAWIDANLPRAWYRPMFAGDAPRAAGTA